MPESVKPDVWDVLLSLTNSADGLSFREEGVRNVVGNTNWNVLRKHIDDARAILADRARPPQDAKPVALGWLRGSGRTTLEEGQVASLYPKRDYQTTIPVYADPPATPPLAIEALREALDDLQQAEHEYREMHDRHGDGSQAAGRAWDRLRVVGDHARLALDAAPSNPSVTVMAAKLPDAERDAYRAAGAAIIARAEQEPARVYLGSGIWWTPSDGFLNSMTGRRYFGRQALSLKPEDGR